MPWGTPIRLVAPATLPLSVAEAKTWLRIERAEEDALIEELIKAAVASLDGPSGLLGWAIEPQTWEVRLRQFETPISIPVGPLTSVAEVRWTDANGDEHLLDAAEWVADLDYGELWPAEGWPSGALSIAVRWVAGAGCPEDVKHQIRVMIARAYENREATGDVGPEIAAALAPKRHIPI